MVDTGSGEKIDVMSKLLQDRIIILGAEVKDEMAQVLVAQMLYLANLDPTQDITMYINSPGGSVSAGMVAWQLHINFQNSDHIRFMILNVQNCTLFMLL